MWKTFAASALAARAVACSPTGAPTGPWGVPMKPREFRKFKNELLMPLGAMIDSPLDYLFAFVTREANDLRYAQDLHEAIEKAIRLQRPDSARKAVRTLLKNTDDMMRKKGLLD